MPIAKSGSKAPLSKKQRLFVQEYLVHFEGARAARRAGYSSKTACAKAWSLLQDPRIAKLIKDAWEKRREATEINAQAVLENLWDTQGRCRQAVPVYDKRGKQIEGVWMFDSGGANKSLELVGRHLGMFKDKLDITITRAAAVDYMERVLGGIYRIVKDETLRDEILAFVMDAAKGDSK